MMSGNADGGTSLAPPTFRPSMSAAYMKRKWFYSICIFLW